MAVPKTEVDRRMDRIEKAIITLAEKLVETNSAFNINDVSEIDNILRGIDGTENRSPTAPEDSSE